MSEGGTRTLLDGKVALITGGTSGLGLETARLFAWEGARVVVTDVSDESGEAALDELRATGADARYVHADVRKSAEVDAAVAFAEETFGRLDIAVANAGILGRSSFVPVEEVTDEDWALELDINLGGVFRTFRAATPALRRAGGGAMSATSSTSGVFATVHRLAYTASKGGVNAIVRGLAAELAPDRIRVNAIAPGAMSTNIRESLGRSPEQIKVPLPDPTLKARMRVEGRDATAEAARVHLFLCSDLSAYITGETIVVDGGFSIWNGT
jgi:NAD(P)-dependent dehydrogenase (short-subunit alcohol dehydrogenase family)